MVLATHLADTSALARLPLAAVAAVLAPLQERGLMATCSPVEAEQLWRTRTSPAYDDWVRQRRALVEWLPTDEEHWQRALAVQGELWRRGQHRAVGWPDLLVAAVAEAAGLVLLHYDADFELVAAVTGQPVEWVAPRGSVP